MGKLSAIQVEQWRKAGKPVAGKSDGDGLTFISAGFIARPRMS